MEATACKPGFGYQQASVAFCEDSLNSNPAKRRNAWLCSQVDQGLERSAKSGLLIGR